MKKRFETWNLQKNCKKELIFAHSAGNIYTDSWKETTIPTILIGLINWNVRQIAKHEIKLFIFYWDNFKLREAVWFEIETDRIALEWFLRAKTKATIENNIDSIQSMSHANICTPLIYWIMNQCLSHVFLSIYLLTQSHRVFQWWNVRIKNNSNKFMSSRQ